MDRSVAWLSRPGTASVFRPREGTAQECRTSSEEINTRTVISMGRTVRLSTSSRRRPPDFRSGVEII